MSVSLLTFVILISIEALVPTCSVFFTDYLSDLGHLITGILIITVLVNQKSQNDPVPFSEIIQHSGMFTGLRQLHVAVVARYWGKRVFSALNPNGNSFLQKIIDYSKLCYDQDPDSGSCRCFA